MKKIDISVIIPIYNVEAYLRECLDSVVEQDCKNFEIICVNDGSTDNSLSILEEYQNKCSVVSVYTKENGGLSSARNYGMKKARGTFLYFLDSDDLLADEHCLSYMVENMKKHSLDAMYFDGQSFFENEFIHQNNTSYDLAYKRARNYGFYLWGSGLFTDMVANGDYYGQVSLQCLRREYLVKNRFTFVDGLLYEDNLFSFKVILLAGSVMHQNRVVFLHRIRSDSIMQSKPQIHNVYSLMYTYQEMIRFSYQIAESQKISKEIANIVNQIKSFAMCIYKKLDTGETDNNHDKYWLKLLLPTKLVLSSQTKSADDAYIFPYHLFHAGDRIVIYGAGNIGRKFYYRAIRDGIVDVVGIVDAKALEMDPDDIPVLSVPMIKQMDYDYILIAIENENTAIEVRTSLVDSGISDYRIKWDGDVYYKKNFYQKSYEYYKYTNRLINVEKKKLFLFMLPEHGNLGDHAIAIAEKRFLTQYFSDYQLICVTTNEFYSLQSYFIESVKPRDIIFFQGGGYIGDLWWNGKSLKTMIDIFPHNIKIIFPNSLAFKDDYEQERDYAEEVLRQLYMKNNLYIFFRDKKSYQFYTKCGYVNRCYYFPDMALYLSDMCGNQNHSNVDSKVLLCFRTDAEKIFSGENRVKEVLQMLGLNYKERDTHLYKYVPKTEEEQYVGKLITEIQESDLVITDRLHGMILSVICGTPCIAMDNSTHKVFSIYEWVKEKPNIALCSEQDLKELPQLIHRVLAVGKLKYNGFEMEFESLAKTIRNIIS